jgi:hypothetical protein
MVLEIDILSLKQATDAILDHIVNDLGVKKLAIKKDSDFYWEVPSDHLYAVKEDQPQLDVGRLSDDLEFIAQMLDTKSSTVAFMLIHLAPLLRYVGEEVGQ